MHMPVTSSLATRKPANGGGGWRMNIQKLLLSIVTTITTVTTTTTTIFLQSRLFVVIVLVLVLSIPSFSSAFSLPARQGVKFVTTTTSSTRTVAAVAAATRTTINNSRSNALFRCNIRDQKQPTSTCACAMVEQRRRRVSSLCTEATANDCGDDPSSSSSDDDDATNKSTTSGPGADADATIEWIPTKIEFENVYRSYGPPSLWRKLTSSVPRREFALENVTLAFGRDGGKTTSSSEDGNSSSSTSINDGDKTSTIYLLLGASSSGKSTILKSILESYAEDGNGSDAPATKKKTTAAVSGSFGSRENRGTVRIIGRTVGNDYSSTAKPIFLDDRGDINDGYSSKTKTTVRDGWNECILREVRAVLSSNNKSASLAMDNKTPSLFADSLLETMATNVFDLDLDSFLADLTPSERYRFSLGKACIQSSVGSGINNIAASNNNYENDDKQPQQRQRRRRAVLRLPGPILLLDEWIDVETSAVVQNVRPSLHKIASHFHGVVVSVTHKPALYDKGSTSTAAAATSEVSTKHKTNVVRKLKLSAGKILSIICI